MKNKHRHFMLSENPNGTVRFLSGFHATLEEGKTQSWVTVTRTGSFSDPRYGKFDITKAMLLSMIKNFDAKVYGQDIFIDVSHRPDNGAAGKVLALKVEGDRLRALVEWTPYGIDAIKNKGYVYLSAEFHENWQDNEAGQPHGCTLLGAGLTVRPVIKKLDPVMLAEVSGNTPTYLHPELQSTLLQEIQIMWDKLIKQLAERLGSLKLAESVVASMTETARKALAGVTDEPAAAALIAAFEDAGKKLAESIGDKSVKLDITLPAPGKTLSEADITRILDERVAAQAAAAKKLAEDKSANVKLLSDTINAATGLDESAKKELAESGADLITPEMTAEQVKKLAENQIALGNKVAAAKQLSALGYGGPAGVIHVEGASGEVKKLSGIYHENLKRTSEFAMGKIKLAEKAHPFVSMVLAEYDRIHAHELHNEVKMLAGETGMANTNLPVGYVREVIREALSDLNVLSLVQTMVDSAATTTTQIPYEQRDVTQVFNDGIVYEGQEIHRAGISQAMDTAYIAPMKIAILVSNEVVHFTRASGINWDALARNLESAARFMRELVCRRIANELQRSADAYGAIAVPAESFTAQLNGANSLIKTVNYPIVRPHQVRDMTGAAVGSAENPISIVLNNVAVTAYDGTGTQAAGTYYRVINHNLGYIQLVNQAGSPVTPATNANTNTVSYSRATNFVKVDLDIPNGSTLEKQLNKALQAIGAQKAMLSGDRYVAPDYMLMSPTLNDTLTNAEQFTEIGQRQDASVSAMGDLVAVKGIPAFGTNAPGIDLGDERIIIGQRGLCGYNISKPFAFGVPFEAVGANGQPIGKKQAYGEEYSAIKVPTPVRNRMTSVLVYSFAGR